MDTSYTHAEWEPQALQDVELVACLQNEATLIETCPYTLENGESVSVERYQYLTAVVLFFSVLAARVLEGGSGAKTAFIDLVDAPEARPACTWGAGTGEPVEGTVALSKQVRFLP